MRTTLSAASTRIIVSALGLVFGLAASAMAQADDRLFVGSEEWVVARAPFDGFLHATNDLDTLGVDERESECRP